MNKVILEKYGVTFLKESDGYIRTKAKDGNISKMMWIYGHPDDVLEFVHDMDLTLNDRYSEIEDPDWSADNKVWCIVADICSDKTLLLYDCNLPDERKKYPLEDIREVFYAWYEFLKANTNL